MANSSKVWCCGTLQTGVIAVAFTNMVSIILLSLWIMQVLVKWRHAFILVVIACLIVFVLIVANVCLIYGAMTKKRHMVIPWLTLYVFAIIGVSVGLIFSCGMGEFEEIQPVSGVAIAFLIYFYVVVATFHAQLKMDEKEEKASAATGSTAAATNKRIANGGDHCLIALGDDNEDIVAGEQDDTFSDLILRPNRSKLDSLGGSAALASQKQNVLPQPDEVIAIPERLQNATEMSNTCRVEYDPRTPGDEEEEDDLEEGQSLLPSDDVVDATSMSLSTKTLPLAVADSSQNSSGSAAAAGSRRYKPAAAMTSASSVATSSSAKNLLRHSNSALLPFDTTFTPHKSGSASALSADMPKIKIFLPKSNDDDDSSSDSSSDDDVAAAAAVNGDDRPVNVST